MSNRETDLFRDRKELKKKAHKVVRGHYLILAFFTLIMVFFGSEFYENLRGSNDILTMSADKIAAGGVYKMVSGGGILSDILTGNLTQSSVAATQRAEEIREEGDINQTLGRTNGVLAEVVIAVTSGKIWVGLAAPFRRLTGSDRAAGILFLLVIFLVVALFTIFIKDMYSVVLRRIFLEARVYEKVTPTDAAHILIVRKWFKASIALLYKNVLEFLWRLTVVGGVIKYYSYFCVPFIIAENPNVGAREAVTLSRKMMDGHKMEAFKYQLSLAGWTIMGYLTLGITDIVYGAPYRLACYSEFYAHIRQEAIDRQIEGVGVLDDVYLFQRASRLELADVYFDVVDEVTLLHEGQVQLDPFRKLVSDWLGVWLGGKKSKQQYDDIEARKYSIARLKSSMTGKVYPDWLNPRWRNRTLSREHSFSPFRNYTIWTVFLLFLAFSFVGWTWEVLLHLAQTGQFANRGTLHGPWLPIYGMGGVIVLLLCSRFRKLPVVEFIVSIVLCGCLEYYISWYLEKTYHERWWSYDGYFLNLNGRICAEGLLVFGIGCCIIVYAVAPIFDWLLSFVNEKILIGVCVVLGVLYGYDAIYSAKHPNMAEGAIEARVSDETESMTEALEENTAETETEAENTERQLRRERILSVLKRDEVRELGELVAGRLADAIDQDPDLLVGVLDSLGINKDLFTDERVTSRIKEVMEVVQ